MARDEAELLEMGARLTRLRETFGYKQEWIAEQCNVKLRTYQFWQQGKHPPGQHSLQVLARIYETTPQYILKGDTPDPFMHAGAAHQLAQIETDLRYLRRLTEMFAGDALVRAVQQALQEEDEQGGETDHG